MTTHKYPAVIDHFIFKSEIESIIGIVGIIEATWAFISEVQIQLFVICMRHRFWVAADVAGSFAQVMLLEVQLEVICFAKIHW